MGTEDIYFWHVGVIFAEQKNSNVPKINILRPHFLSSVPFFSSVPFYPFYPLERLSYAHFKGTSQRVTDPRIVTKLLP